MQKIDPGLFTRLMRLPDTARVDLLEFIGATPLADVQLQQMIDTIAAQIHDSRQPRHEPN